MLESGSLVWNKYTKTCNSKFQNEDITYIIKPPPTHRLYFVLPDLIKPTC